MTRPLEPGVDELCVAPLTARRFCARYFECASRGERRWSEKPTDGGRREKLKDDNKEKVKVERGRRASGASGEEQRINKGRSTCTEIEERREKHGANGGESRTEREVNE